MRGRRTATLSFHSLSSHLYSPSLIHSYLNPSPVSSTMDLFPPVPTTAPSRSGFKSQHNSQHNSHPTSTISKSNSHTTMSSSISKSNIQPTEFTAPPPSNSADFMNATRSSSDTSRPRKWNTDIPLILPHEKVFPIQIGSECFRLSGASISSDGECDYSPLLWV